MCDKIPKAAMMQRAEVDNRGICSCTRAGNHGFLISIFAKIQTWRLFFMRSYNEKKKKPTVFYAKTIL